jgi:hypothetical protein
VKSDLLSLITRLFELSTKLFNERVDLARGELQGVGRRAIWLYAGGLMCAVGIAFLGAAAVELLGSWIHNRALRLFLVAVPLVAVGLFLILRVLARAAADHGDHDRQEREHQKDMRPAAEALAGHQPHQQ